VCSSIFVSGKASGFDQSSCDPYDCSSDDEEDLTPKSMVKMTPRCSDLAACLLTAARLNLNSPPEAPMNWGQFNPNLDDYHAEPMEIRSILWLPDITNWWCQHEETYSKYADLTNVACNIFSIIPPGGVLEASHSLGRDVIGWKQSKTNGNTIPENVLLRLFLRANNGMLPHDFSALDSTDTDNNLELKKEVEEWKLQKMAKVHNVLAMWQGSHNLRAKQQGSRAQIKQMTAVGHISDTEEIIKASWSNCQHNGVAACKLSERSPLPSTLTAKDLPGGPTQALNVCWITRIDCHLAESDEASAPETISVNKTWLAWNGDLDNPDGSDGNWEAVNESDLKLYNCIEALETPEH